MFKTLMTTVAATGFFVAAAWAATTQGTVQAFDPTTGMIMLDSGETFTVPQGTETSALVPGTQVEIVYADGTTEAQEITIIQ